MNVLITSATGYIGSAVTRALQSHGHQVVGIARSAASAKKLELVGVHPHRGDLNDVNSQYKPAQQADAVIHTAATNDFDMAMVDQLAVKALLAALARSQKPFVYTSGIWVMGNTGELLADETLAVNPPQIVAWRPAIEDLVLAAAANGVRSVVIRPALVYGHGGGLLAMLTKAGFDQRAVPVIDMGNNFWSLVHVDDLATLYVKAVEQAPAGTLLIGASGESVPFQKLALAAADVAGVGVKLQHITLETAHQIWGDLADAMVLNQRVSGDRAKRLLNWTPIAPSALAELTNGSYRQMAIPA